MTNKEQIELLLKHGLHVSAKDKDGEYQIISPMKDKWGNYRASNWHDTLEGAKQNIGEYYGYPNLEEACKHWTEITPFHLDFEPYPVGMKVKMIKTGKVEEISEIKYKGMYTLKDFPAFSYSHTELIPYFEKPTITLTDDELLAECERRAIITKIVK